MAHPLGPIFDADESIKKVGDKRYWLGSEIAPCSMCGDYVVAVDNCGEFGNSKCPLFGKDRDKCDDS